MDSINTSSTISYRRQKILSPLRSTYHHHVRTKLAEEGALKVVISIFPSSTPPSSCYDFLYLGGEHITLTNRRCTNNGTIPIMPMFLLPLLCLPSSSPSCLIIIVSAPTNRKKVGRRRTDEIIYISLRFLEVWLAGTQLIGVEISRGNIFPVMHIPYYRTLSL